MRIVQIVPEVALGSGVEAVAYHLEREWQRLGIPTARFTLADAAGGWLPTPGPGLRGRAALAARVVWFSTVGTVLARRRLSPRRLALTAPGTVTICHNDVLYGDVYVNHGVVAAAMRARGGTGWRMVRNPLHLFTWARDAVRFASTTHRAVVHLTSPERAEVRRTYPRVRPRDVVLGNGVDAERYQPHPERRQAERERWGIPAGAVVGLFVGHEFERKGLPALLAALPGCPAELHLLVVGSGAPPRHLAGALGVAGRVHFAGALPDPRPAYHASDFLVLPSAYESFGLVVLEALACGLPVVATPVGCVPDVVVDGVTGVLVTAEPAAIQAAMTRLVHADRAAMARAARTTALAHTWPAIAQAYLRLCEEVRG